MAKKAKKAVLLVVASKVRAYVKDQDMRIGADAMAQLSIGVEKLINDAITAARNERRQTIKDRDITV